MGKRWSNARKRQKNRDAANRGNDRDADEKKKGKKDAEEMNPYELSEIGNFKLEAYYAAQGVHDYRLDENSSTFVMCTTDEEKEAERQRWLEAMKGILPASFRIGADVDEALRQKLEKELDEYVGKTMEIEFQPKGGDRRIKEKGLKPVKKMVAPAKKIPFVPHAYQLALDRQTLRRNTNPALTRFHEWLKIQTEAGFITRQETVSMIPPVVLNPKPYHKVLDMCAAPGSKTSQLLEVVNLPAKVGDTEPTGFVIANDSDYKRAYMLTHHVRRINSPGLLITCCDAKFMPTIKDPDHPTEGIFDRVLCDVPCSGDGTSRKNPGIWKRWSALNGIGLHNIQLAIAVKGARLTRVGGHLVYSTCSMNPMENEAVVAELLRAAEGSLELIDPRNNLDGMVARPGISTWKVLCESRSSREVKNENKKKSQKMKERKEEWEKKSAADSDGKPDGITEDEVTNRATVESKVEDTPTDDEPKAPSKPRIFEPSTMEGTALTKLAAEAGLDAYATYEQIPENLRGRVRKSCFPPSVEEREALHLERCLRILPQDMNTGGFFVCLLKKVAPINPRARRRLEQLEEELGEEEKGDDPNQTKSEEPQTKKPKLDEETTLAKNEKDSDAVVRGHVKRVYLKDENGNKDEKLGRDDFVPIPQQIFDPLREYYGLSTTNFQGGNYMARACGEMRVLYFITTAIKALIDDGFQEKVTVIHSGVKGFTRCNKECEVTYRLSQEGVHFVAPHMTKRKIIADVDDFGKCLEPFNVPLDSFSKEFSDQVRPLSMGCFVVCLKGYENDYLKKLVLVVWRCRGDACNSMVNKAELDGMKSKLRSITGESAP